MIWWLRRHGPDGVFVSGTQNGLYAECWPSEALRPHWGHKQAFDGYDLYPYYMYIGQPDSVVKVYKSNVYTAFGSLEECMDAAEGVLATAHWRRPDTGGDDRKFTP